MQKNVYQVVASTKDEVDDMEIIIIIQQRWRKSSYPRVERIAA